MDRRRSNVLGVSCSFTNLVGAVRTMGIELLSDESILRFYEDIRTQVAADLATEKRFRLMGGEAVPAPYGFHLA
jgi:hypothetical protein